MKFVPGNVFYVLKNGGRGNVCEVSDYVLFLGSLVDIGCMVRLRVDIVSPSWVSQFQFGQVGSIPLLLARRIRI